jgi:hypothetical protein
MDGEFWIKGYFPVEVGARRNCAAHKNMYKDKENLYLIKIG